MNLNIVHVDFSQQYLQATLFVSLLSVWVLVGLFFYLNRYTKRDYFSVWTVAWLFYALWLTLGLTVQGFVAETFLFAARQCCVAISAVFLLWGTVRFLSLPARQSLFGLFMLFLILWTISSTLIFSIHKETLQIQLPVFVLIGLASLFAGVCFYRVRQKMPYVGAGMLALGFLLWGVYLASYPFSEQDPNLYHAGFLVAAVLQLFIAVSMIVLVLEEARHNSDLIRAEIAAVRSEKETLQAKVLTAEEQSRNLYEQVRLTEGAQKAYEELRRTQQVVVQQERLRALGQMASGIVHDINNALSPVTAYSEVLLTMPDLPEPARHHLGSIKTAGEDIAHIVARMREFYRPRLDTERLARTDLNRLIAEVVELTRPRWRDLPQRDGISIHIDQDLDPHLKPFWTDPSELREALTNLIFNAVEAMPQGGAITLRTRVTEDKNDSAANQIQVEVQDTGTGMDEKTRQRCLEPFFSTKAKIGGTGLGLAMVYGMMQRHGGTINIDSAPGQGTCIRLVFPRRTTTTTENAKPAGPVAKRSLHLLCIDDEMMVRQMLADCLTRFNHQVTVAATGGQGLDLLRQSSRDHHIFDAIITDLGIPDIDGREIVRHIKKEFPGIPVVMMTGWGTMMKQDDETVDGVDALVGKPPRIRELNDLLLRLTDKS